MASTRQKSTGNPEDLYKKGLIALEGGQYEYAIALFRDSLKIDPNFTKANDGIKTAKTRRLQKSNPFSRALKKPLFTLQGASYKKLKNYDRALDKYESAFALPNPSYKLLAPLGDLYYEKGMTDNASAAYKSVLQKEPDNIHCLRKLGRIYIDQGNMPEAKKIYDHLASTAASDDAVMKEVKDAYALLTIDRGRWEEEGSFHRKVKKEESEEKQVSSGDSLPPSEKSRLGDKVTALKKQAEKEPDNVSVKKELADVLNQLRRFDEAIPLYKKILQEDPDNMDVLRSAGNIYIKTGEHEKAVKILEHIHNLLPDNTNVLKILAETYIKQDAPLKAIEAYLKLSELKPGDAGIHETLGRLYEQNRYFEEAIAQYDRVIEISPEKAGLHENIGNLYLRDAKPEKALERYEKAAMAYPENIPLKKTLADLYLKQNRFDDAEKKFREILEIDPGDSKIKARLEQSEISAKEKKIEEADSRIKELEDALAKNPGSEETRQNLEEQKKKKAALRVEILLHSLKNRPEDPEARFELGTAYMKKGDTDSAIKEFQQAAQSPEKAVESLHMLGMCFEAKNILDIAARQLEKAEAKLTETNELKKAVLYDLGRVYEKRGEKDKALDKYKEIYEVDISYRDVGEKIERAYG